MGVLLLAEIDALIDQHVRSGDFASTEEAIQVAMSHLAKLERRHRLKTLVDEARAEVVRGDVLPASDALFDDIVAAGIDAANRGEQIPDHVKP